MWSRFLFQDEVTRRRNLNKTFITLTNGKSKLTCSESKKSRDFSLNAPQRSAEHRTDIN